MVIGPCATVISSPLVYDSQLLVRVGPHDLKPGHPARMLRRRVPLQVSRPHDPMAAALDRGRAPFRDQFAKGAAARLQPPGARFISSTDQGT
jgi:hypothetical protein